MGKNFLGMALEYIFITEGVVLSGDKIIFTARTILVMYSSIVYIEADYKIVVDSVIIMCPTGDSRH